MTVNKLNDLKIPIFKVNPALDAYKNIPMFEDKIAEANKVLRTVGLPLFLQSRRMILLRCYELYFLLFKRFPFFLSELR